MSNPTEPRTSPDASDFDRSFIPVIALPERCPPDQDMKSLVEWFSSDEFQQRLTQGFGDAKRKAIEERDRILKSQDS
jgi:hypothetical protein